MSIENTKPESSTPEVFTKVTIWARVGVTISVDAKEVKANPGEAVRNALAAGDYKLDGDTYVPENLIEEYVEAGILSADVDNEEQLSFEI